MDAQQHIDQYRASAQGILTHILDQRRFERDSATSRHAPRRNPLEPLSVSLSLLWLLVSLNNAVR